MAAPETGSKTRRPSKFRTSDCGGSESPLWHWDYAEVYDDDDDDDDDDVAAVVSNRGRSNRGSHRSKRSSAVWDYHEITPGDNSWDCRNLPRMQIRSYARMLAEEGTVGNFLIRCKQDNSGYALTLKVNPKGDFLTYLVEPLEDGNFGIRGCGDDEAFSTIDELVHFYSTECRESIGVQLKIPSASLNNNGGYKRRRSVRNPADLSEALLAANKILAANNDGNNPAPELEWPGTDDVDAASLGSEFSSTSV